MPMMTDRRHSCGGHFFKTRLPPFLPSGCFPIIYRLSQPVNQWKVCAVTSRQGKVREARSKPAAARIVPFHAGASTCRNNTVFHSPTGLYAAGFGLSASVPYLSLVTCHVKGKRRYFLSAPRFHSARSKFRRGTDKENPFHVCPGRPLPDPPKPHSFLLHFLLHLYPARPYPLLPSYFPDRSRLFSAVAVRFSNCKGRLPRLIRRLEVHSLQILPFCERVIGRENRCMKPCRQSCTASVKSRNGSSREKNRKKGKKQMFHIKESINSEKSLWKFNLQSFVRKTKSICVTKQVKRM